MPSSGMNFSLGTRAFLGTQRTGWTATTSAVAPVSWLRTRYRSARWMP
jgi:hypothetical protein